MSSAPSTSSAPRKSAEDPVEAAWRHVLEHWEEEAAHEAFLALCADLGQLGEAGKRYRAVQETSDDPARSADAKQYVDRVLGLAVTLMQTERGDASRIVRRGKLVLYLLATLFFLLAGAWTLALLGR